jgi:hypothetical protein
VLDAKQQASLVHLLDECGSVRIDSEYELEGLATLALAYQHGIRPVQLLSLRVEHLRVLQDASGDSSCLVSFHAAKQAFGGEYEMVRQVRPEWARIVIRLLEFATKAARARLFAATTSEQLWARVRAACARKGVDVTFTAYALRHTAAQSLADAGQNRSSIQTFLEHGDANAANAYLRASRELSNTINHALGASKLYGKILSLADHKFVSVQEMEEADEDQQIGAVVGERLVGGVGLCSSGQSSCRYNPVTSCYGCPKFMPSLDRFAHEQAVAGMRQQVLSFKNQRNGTGSTGYLQLTRALAGAQEALVAIDAIGSAST